MRQTKCKECYSERVLYKGHPIECSTCQGTGEISVYTIQELREGKVVLQREGNRHDVIKVVNIAWPNTGLVGTSDYYGIGVDGSWYASNERSVWTNLPTQSVKIFLEEIEHEEYKNCPCGNCRPDECAHKIEQEDINVTQSIEEPEFKWGEEVEAYLSGEWKPVLYCCIDPREDCDYHIVIPQFGGEGYKGSSEIRKPQKITITLSQIAEKFGVKKEQIVITE